MSTQMSDYQGAKRSRGRSPASIRNAERRSFGYSPLHQAVDVRVQRTQAVGQRLGQHRNDAAREVHAGAALERVFVQRVAGTHVVADVGDGHQQAPARTLALARAIGGSRPPAPRPGCSARRGCPARRPAARTRRSAPGWRRRCRSAHRGRRSRPDSARPSSRWRAGPPSRSGRGADLARHRRGFVGQRQDRRLVRHGDDQAAQVLGAAGDQCDFALDGMVCHGKSPACVDGDSILGRQRAGMPPDTWSACRRSPPRCPSSTAANR